MKFQFDDGGRSKYFKGQVGDCGVRALAIASGNDYKETYNLVKKIVGYSPRNGIQLKDFRFLDKKLGYKWVACMKIGSGCKVHLRDGEIPMKGSIICSVSRHYVAVIDGVIHDLYDCSREGNRCVYGYWVIKEG